MAFLQVKNIAKSFCYGAIKAVEDLSFSANKGDVLGFLGPNGAGKSTSMKIITGFLDPDQGSVWVNGINLADDPVTVKSKSGYLPEGAPAYGEMRVIDFLYFIGKIRLGYYCDVKRIKARVLRIAEKTNLESVLYQSIDTLSKGFKRRVGLAQAILHDPDLLILDEPTDGLDPNQKHEVRKLIQEMSSDKVIILSTHILEEVEAVCNRVIIISDGKLLIDSTPIQLMDESSTSLEIIFRKITQGYKYG